MSISLLIDIEAFLAGHGIAESTFGREALGDWRFISELRGSADKKPRRVWPETEAKVRQYMADYSPTVGAPDIAAAQHAEAGKSGDLTDSTRGVAA